MLIALIVVGVLFVLWVLLNLKTSRPDATLIPRIHPYRTMMFHIMPTRNESVVYFDTVVDAEKLLAYLEATKAKFHCDVTHCLVAACMFGMKHNPSMNRFTKGERIYQRKGTWISFSMKRQKLNKAAKLVAVKMEARDEENFEQLCARINGSIKEERSDKVTSADKEYNLLTSLPRPLLKLGVRLFRWMDYYNILPGSFIRFDPMYCSIFIANLGSVGMAPGYHHLYEWGTASLFMMVGRIEERAVVKDGQIVIQKCLPIRFTYDERADDGLTAGHGINSAVRVLEDPFTYLGCVKGDGTDAKPILADVQAAA
ncbi:MAG: 2-oxo acid dehydrogenase subunit E2 [Deltaproteobacteria bacterium]|nr:2-oxo acid dehydrogenase subunit E2 [Deltaproteobacteria bacterium]